RNRLERFCQRIRHRNQENEEAKGKSGCSHPVTSEKEKTARRKTAKERQGQQGEAIIIGRGSPREIQPVDEHQSAETTGQGHDRERKIDNVLFWQLITPEVKQVSRNERYQQNVRIQLTPGCVFYQRQEGLAESCQQNNRKTRACPKPPQLPMIRRGKSGGVPCLRGKDGFASSSFVW